MAQLLRVISRDVNEEPRHSKGRGNAQHYFKAMCGPWVHEKWPPLGPDKAGGVGGREVAECNFPAFVLYFFLPASGTMGSSTTGERS